MGRKRKKRGREIMRGMMKKGAFGNGGGEQTIPSPIPPAALRSVRNLVSAVAFGDDDLDEAKPLHYLVGANGLFLHKRSEIGEVLVQIGKTTGPEMKAVPKLNEGWVTSLPKIPFHIFSPAIAFLREVKRVHDTEGLVRFFFHEGEWTAHVPTQDVTAVSVNVSPDDPSPAGLFAAEIHSHPGGSSVFSSTDDAHEQLDRVFMCVAFPGSSQPDFHARIGTGLARWLDCSLSTVVDMNTDITLRGKVMMFLKGDMFPYFDFPKEWMEKVRKESYRSQGSGYHTRVVGIGGGDDSSLPFTVTDKRRLVMGNGQGYSGQLNGTLYINGVPQSHTVGTRQTPKESL